MWGLGLELRPSSLEAGPFAISLALIFHNTCSLVATWEDRKYLFLKRLNPSLKRLHTHFTSSFEGICQGFDKLQFSTQTDLLKPAVLLQQGRRHTGAAGGRGVHIVVSEAAEEGAEDATAPLLLQADAALGSWERNTHCEWPRHMRTAVCSWGPGDTPHRL